MMNDQERQVIDDIFRRLESAAAQPREPEAERYIAEKVRRQPYAPYAMAQSLFVQEQALANLNTEVERLRAEVEQLRSQPQGGGGFLSSLFGGAPRQPEAPRGGSPWGRPSHVPQQGYGHMPPHQTQQGFGQRPGGMMGGGPWGGGMGGGMGRGGGGFLQTALGTAAGVAGGVMLANALSNAFGADNPAAADTASLAGSTGGDAAGDAGNAGITDSLYQDASANQADYGGDDFGGDAGDGGDWA